ncbi:SGNH hydrolase [Penicillium canariense]|uniref:SGNH hydrolase n=1 Tax=Penicillium canariense TaxID=189055 RepID=A0A9W9HQP9_9EURO|nr:SGNH hydrolase [Penicillium canariense]KAJ5153372.1 SGNH hydrolase [Penicillium canariense]
MWLSTVFFIFAIAAARGPEKSSLSPRNPAIDPEDFSWIANWAAVGDSFTAGIGSGNVYSSRKADKSCSRYDYSYPSIMNQIFGSSVESFQYSACSGATSIDIAAQIDALSGVLDLAVMTAGGNDLCLTGIITTCILNSVTSESSCQKAITAAQSAIDSILEDNIVSLLTSLDAKMDSRGMIVLASYAPYFNNQTDDCTNNEDWVFPGQAGGTSLLLTKAHRTSFNTLVANTNAKLKSAVDNAAKTASSTIVFADWSAWGEATNGRFCEPGSSPDPDDSSNDNALFFKLPTYKVFNPGVVYRDLAFYPLAQMESASNLTSVNPTHEQAGYTRLLDSIADSLEKRDGPTAGACTKSVVSNLLPDGIGKIFHPTNLGHEAIASYVTWAIANAMAELEDTTTPACNIVDELKCYQVSGSQSYASAYSLYMHTADFCKDAVSSLNEQETGSLYTDDYNKDTTDHVTFTVTKDTGAVDLTEQTCNLAVNHILDGCDGNDDNNPMNWKFGGTYINGAYTYKIAPVRTNRPFPAPKEPSAQCTGVFHGFWTRYNIRGAGWATWDNGQKSLRPNSTHCFGKGLTGWWFEYFDEPDSNGYEWLAKFNSPVGTEARCYSNNKVQKGAGGPSNDGCH